MPIKYAPEKDPSGVEWYFFVYCDLAEGTNVAGDNGDLQGETISSYTVAVSSTDIVIDSDNKSAVTIGGISYGASTVVSVKLSAGVDATNYNLRCVAVTSGGRTLPKTMVVPVRTQ